MDVTKLNVVLTLTEPMLGTVPKNPEVYKTYIATKAREQAAGDEEVATVPVSETEKSGWTGFHQDADGIFVYDYMIRGFLKAAATALKDQMKLTAQRSKIDQFVFVRPRKIHFLRDGQPIKIVDGVVERPLRAQTMQGPRVTLTRSDYMAAGTMVSFDIEIIQSAKGVSVEQVKELFEYGKYSGLGQFRNGSYGRFEAIVTQK